MCKFCHDKFDRRTGVKIRQGQNPAAKYHKTHVCHHKHMHHLVFGGSPAFGGGGSPAFVVGGGGSPAFVVGGGYPAFVVGRTTPTKSCGFCHGAGNNPRAKPHSDHECKHPANPSGVKAQKMAAAFAAFAGGGANQMAVAVVGGPKYGDIRGQTIYDGMGWKRILHIDLQKNILTYSPGEGEVARIIAIPGRK